MKRIFLFIMAVFALCLQNVNAQDAIKIITGHPDFNIKVKRCVASDKTVLIDMVFINEGTQDVNRVKIHLGNRGSLAYDDEGNIYEGGYDQNISIKIANREYDPWYTSDFEILAGVPTKVTMKIKGVSLEAQSFAKIIMNFDCPAWDFNNSPVTLRNIPISRK